MSVKRAKKNHWTHQSLDGRHLYKFIKRTGRLYFWYSYRGCWMRDKNTKLEELRAR